MGISYLIAQLILVFGKSVMLGVEPPAVDGADCEFRG
jgi:hypothetical protein